MYKIIHIPTALPIIEYVELKHKDAEIIGPLDGCDFGIITFKTEDSAKKYLDYYYGGYLDPRSKPSNGLVLYTSGPYQVPPEHFEIVEVHDV